MPIRSVTMLVTLALMSTSSAIGVGDQVDRAPAPDQSGNYLFRWKDSGGSDREFLFVPGGKIAPQIGVTVSRQDGVSFLYRYLIANGRTAVEKLANCYVDVAMPARIINTPAGWESGQPSEIAPRAGWFMLRFTDGVPNGAPPGSEVDGFEIASVNLPGATEFTCWGDGLPHRLPDDLPTSIVEQLDTVPGSREVVVRSIGPVIPRPDDPIPTLLRRVIRNYRQPLAASAHQSRKSLVAALDQLGDALTAGDRNRLLSTLTGLADQLGQNTEDPWGRQLAKGLYECITYVFTRLEQTR